MSERWQVIEGSMYMNQRSGLIYTRKCGWIDLGHARPDGIMELWTKMKTNNSRTERNKYYEIS